MVFNRRAHTPRIDKAAFRHVCVLCASFFSSHVVYIIEKRLLVFFCCVRGSLWKSTVVVILLRLQRGTRLCWVGAGCSISVRFGRPGAFVAPGRRIFRGDFIKNKPTRKKKNGLALFLFSFFLSLYILYTHLYLKSCI